MGKTVLEGFLDLFIGVGGNLLGNCWAESTMASEKVLVQCVGRSWSVNLVKLRECLRMFAL